MIFCVCGNRDLESFPQVSLWRALWIFVLYFREKQSLLMNYSMTVQSKFNKSWSSEFTANSCLYLCKTLTKFVTSPLSYSESPAKLKWEEEHTAEAEFLLLTTPPRGWGHSLLPVMKAEGDSAYLYSSIKGCSARSILGSFSSTPVLFLK